MRPLIGGTSLLGRAGTAHRGRLTGGCLVEITPGVAAGTACARSSRVTKPQLVWQLAVPSLFFATACTSGKGSTENDVAHELAQRAKATRTSATSTGAVTRLNMTEPFDYWEREGFVLMVPSVRMSIPPGGRAGTVVYFKVPGDEPISLARHPSPEIPASFEFPPGTEAHRVAFLIGSDSLGDPTLEIMDVRGTRIGEDGEQYYHVMRPSSMHGGSLAGYEWRRGDDEGRALATRLLLEDLSKEPDPPSSGAMARIAVLNHCEFCHVEDKGPSPPSSELPPWPTDGSGFYIPLGVVFDHAPLSTVPELHDPNADDPYVETSCRDAVPPTVGGGPHNRFFTCEEEDTSPVGRRDIRRGLVDEDTYTSAVCGSRHFLSERMSEHARTAFAPLLQECARPDLVFAESRE